MTETRTSCCHEAWDLRLCFQIWRSRVKRPNETQGVEMRRYESWQTKPQMGHKKLNVWIFDWMRKDSIKLRIRIKQRDLQNKTRWGRRQKAFMFPSKKIQMDMWWATRVKEQQKVSDRTCCGISIVSKKTPNANSRAYNPEPSSDIEMTSSLERAFEILMHSKNGLHSSSASDDTEGMNRRRANWGWTSRLMSKTVSWSCCIFLWHVNRSFLTRSEVYPHDTSHWHGDTSPTHEGSSSRHSGLLTHDVIKLVGSLLDVRLAN